MDNIEIVDGIDAQLAQQSPPNQQDEIMNKLMEILFSDQDLERKTELEKPLIFAALEAKTRFYKLVGGEKCYKTLRNFLSKYYKLQFSNKRKSREEAVDIFKTIQMMQPEPLQDESTLLEPPPIKRRGFLRKN
jgi:hypothetical protein